MPVLQERAVVPMCVGMLRVALDRRSELALCTVDVMPVLHEERAEVVMRVGMLRIALNRR
jgi:hypothetical protein